MNIQFRRVGWSLFAVSIFVSIFIIIKKYKVDQSELLTVYAYEEPKTLDPIDYDAVRNFIIQNLVSIKLFSDYRDSKISGQLAEKWRESNSSAVWKVNIRSDVRFSDGALVEPVDVVKSLSRILFLMKKRHSSNEVLFAIEDIQNLTSATTSRFRGIRLEGRAIIFEFKRPVKNFPEMFSFGLFSIVNSNNFDPVSGEWRHEITNPFIGAGPYSYKRISSGQFQFILRNNYPPDLLHSSAYREIRLQSVDKSPSSSDIRDGRDDLQIERNGFSFHGLASAQVSYFELHPWNLKTSPLSDRKVRQYIRTLFFSEMMRRSFPPTRSFFPLIMSGIGEPERSGEMQLNADTFRGSKISFYDKRSDVASLKSNLAEDALEAAIRIAGFDAIPLRGMNYDDESKNQDSDLSKYSVDIGFYSTDLSPTDPEGDIRFMFSTEGVRLPDCDGKIRTEISKSSFSPQVVNELLYDQAIIWPIYHYTMGIWAKNRLDLSRYNTLFPLGELQWIGKK